MIKEGDRFGRLTVKRLSASLGGRYRVELRCDCGSDVEDVPSRLLSGRVKTCGCYGRGRPSAEQARPVERVPEPVEQLRSDLNYLLAAVLDQEPHDELKERVTGIMAQLRGLESKR